jgi:hypothetical protein
MAKIVKRRDPIIALIEAKQYFESVLASPKAPQRKRVAALFAIGRLERRLLRRQACTVEGSAASLDLALWELDQSGEATPVELLRWAIANGLSPLRRQCAKEPPKSGPKSTPDDGGGFLAGRKQTPRCGGGTGFRSCMGR